MKTKKMLEVEEEYGQDFWEVVKGYAEDRLSIAATATVLGFSKSRFYRIVDVHGKRHLFVNGYESEWYVNREMPAPKKTESYFAGLKKAAEKNTRYFLEYMGVCDTVAGHCRRLKLKAKTVYRRIESGKSPKQALDMGHPMPSGPAARS